MARTLGAWDCEYCETKGMLGNVFDCPGCGKPRSRNVQFYQIPNAPEVTPEIAEQLGSGGPNWYCNSCDAGNKDSDKVCVRCHTPQGNAALHKITDYGSGKVPSSTQEAKDSEPDGRSWVFPDEPVDTSSDDAQSSYGFTSMDSNISEDGYAPNGERQSFPIFKNWRSLAGVGVAIAAVVVVGVLVNEFFFKTHAESVRVSEYTWTQTTNVNEYQVVHETSWTSHPDAAYNISSDYRDTGNDRKVHDGWRTVPYMDTCYRTETYMDTCYRSVYHSRTCSGTRSNGDGSFDSYTYECGSSSSESYSCSNTRQVPYSCAKTRQEEIYHYEDIWDTLFTYDINKWVQIASYPTAGADHHPLFESVTLKNPYDGAGTPELGQQTKEEVTGEYTITFCSDNEKVGDKGCFTRTYPLETWTKFQGAQYEIQVNWVGTVMTEPTP